jgi:hypothetical protein
MPTNFSRAIMVGGHNFARKGGFHFFLSLSSRYSCSICSYMYTYQLYSHTSLTPHTCINKHTTTLRSVNRVLLEITGVIRRRRGASQSLCDTMRERQLQNLREKKMREKPGGDRESSTARTHDGSLHNRSACHPS